MERRERDPVGPAYSLTLGVRGARAGPGAGGRDEGGVTDALRRIAHRGIAWVERKFARNESRING